MTVVARTRDAALAAAAARAAANLERTLQLAADDAALEAALRDRPAVLLLDARTVADLPAWRERARAAHTALLVAFPHDADPQAIAEVAPDEWLRWPAEPAELEARLRAAVARSRRAHEEARAARQLERLRYEELLYDRFTGLPTLPLMLDVGRRLLEDTGRLTLLYIRFVRYSKLEEIYGWQKLDEILETTARALRDYARARAPAPMHFMVAHTGDDDFIVFLDLPGEVEGIEPRLHDFVRGLEDHLRQELEQHHGEEIAGLCEIYIGATTLFRNPKVRAARLIYRGLREAAEAARSVESRERFRRIDDFKALLREGQVRIEYHPIVEVASGRVVGYEALARGTRRGLRSPELLFALAEEADLLWELSRLCRRRALEGMDQALTPDQLLFLNVDPTDFRDPSFRALELEALPPERARRIVIEITERTAITDYPTFRSYLDELRQRGFRFAVDDAGAGYAGLGSIANLAPDFIKLDLSLIANIDANFMKQRLVQTIVQFANEHGIRVVAEGVEREEELATVRELGVHLAQGFLFHRPSGGEDGSPTPTSTA